MHTPDMPLISIFRSYSLRSQAVELSGSCVKDVQFVEFNVPVCGIFGALKTFERLSSILKITSWAVDSLFSIFLGSIEMLFLFIRQTQPVPKWFFKRNIIECFQKNCREKVTCTKSWREKAGLGQKGEKC